MDLSSSVFVNVETRPGKQRLHTWSSEGIVSSTVSEASTEEGIVSAMAAMVASEGELQVETPG